MVFAFFNKGSDEALQQIQSKDPKMSGLVIVVPSSEREVIKKSAELNKDKLRIFVVNESQGKDAALQETERWMVSEGLA